MLMEIVVAKVDRCHYLSVLTQLTLKPSGCACRLLENAHRTIRLILAPDAGKELIHNMHDGNHFASSFVKGLPETALSASRILIVLSRQTVPAVPAALGHTAGWTQ